MTDNFKELLLDPVDVQLQKLLGPDAEDFLHPTFREGAKKTLNPMVVQRKRKYACVRACVQDCVRMSARVRVCVRVSEHGDAGDVHECMDALVRVRLQACKGARVRASERTRVSLQQKGAKSQSLFLSFFTCFL